MLDDAALGAATEVTAKFVSPADPAARCTGAHGGQTFFAYSTNYLIDVEHAVIVDVEATTAVGASIARVKIFIHQPRKSIDFEVIDDRCRTALGASETRYGSGDCLNCGMNALLTGLFLVLAPTRTSPRQTAR